MRFAWLALSLSFATAAHAETDGPRARWACGVLGGYDTTYSPTSDPLVAFGGGLYTRAGVQWDERLDLEVDASVGTILFLNFVRGALLFGLTYDWITVSVGPVLAANARAFVEVGAQTSVYAAVGARIDFHFWQHVSDTGRRWAFTGSISGEFGHALQETARVGQEVTGYAWGAYTSIGPTWY